MSTAAVDMDAADQLETQMRQQVRYLLEDGASPAKVARDYQLLRRDAERAIETLNRAVTMAEFHATAVRDPYKSYSDLMDKYEGLRPSLGG